MKALLIVDVQNDFCPGGALAVPEGDEVVEVANALSPRFPLVIATQDWHPQGHGSFADSHPGKEPGETITLGGLPQILWPVHCVEYTPGAKFHPALNREPFGHVVRKGTERDIDSYSAFFDNGHRKDTGLTGYLKTHKVTEVYVLGLALDYCVKLTALDAVKQGFDTYLVRDGCRAVNLSKGDDEAAVDEMVAAGVTVTRSERISLD